MEMPLWFSNLAFWSIQVALLALAAGILARALQIHQPRVLLASWRSLLAVSLLLPFVHPWHRPQNATPIVVSPDFVGVPLPPPSVPAVDLWHLPSLQSLAPFFGALILIGIALRFVALALGLLKLRRLRQTSSPIPSSMESDVVLEATRALVAARAEFRLSAQVDSPVTFGFLAPVVLLPESFASLDERFQSAIACHELLHVRRRDWAHHVGEEVLRALFWFHPAIAWLISRVRLAREQVVDLEVVALTNARKPYLEALLEFTNSRASIAGIPAPPFLAERQLVDRVTLMLKEVRMSRTRLIASLTVIASCLALVISLAARTSPLKAAPLSAQLVSQNASSQEQKGPSAPVPELQRLEVNYHNFDDSTENKAAVNAAQARVSRLLDHPEAGTVYDQAKADEIKRVLEDFWSARGITVEVRGTLTPWPRSSDYVILKFDVYKQTVLPGKLEGGVAGGVSQGISGGVAGGISKGMLTVLAAASLVLSARADLQMSPT